jgi:hypothetical protein
LISRFAFQCYHPPKLPKKICTPEVYVNNKSPRQWQDIAAELSNEFDAKRVTELSAELTEALDQELKIPKNQRRAAAGPA